MITQHEKAMTKTKIILDKLEKEVDEILYMFKNTIDNLNKIKNKPIVNPLVVFDMVIKNEEDNN